MITFAKGVTNGAVPMGGVLLKSEIYQAFEAKEDYAIDLFHGYTYTGHPLAAAAGIATLDLYRDEGLFERGLAIEPKFRDAVFGLKDAPHVTRHPLRGACRRDRAGTDSRRGREARL